jgi:hypothetical protein
MKEVIRYLDRIKNNIIDVRDLRIQHSIMISILEKDGNHLTKDRLKEFKKLNNKISDVLIDFR